MSITGIEGLYEASYQFVLQLFVVLKKADRQPLTIQILTMVTSLMSIVISNIKNKVDHCFKE